MLLPPRSNFSAPAGIRPGRFCFLLISMPLTKADFIDLLRDEALLSANDMELLTVVYAAEAYSATAPEIAKALGYPHFVTANSMVGRLGKKLARAKGLPLRRRANQSEAGWDVIFDGHESARGFVWTLKEALKQAMDELQVDTDTSPTDAAADLSLPLFEGGRKVIEVNAYERSRIARYLCIQHYGPVCRVCSFDFEQTYGAIGKDYIHVHHLVPLAAVSASYKVDPVADLIPVCPNCHAMLHRRPQPYSVQELQAMLRT